MIWIILSYVFIFIVAIRILLRPNRTPASRLAWLTVIFALPGVGNVIYLLFGETSIGAKRTKRVRQVIESLPKMHRIEGMKTAISSATLSSQMEPLVSVGRSISGYDAVGGNRAELMADSDTTIDRMIADIDAAQSHVHVLYYIWLDDRTGTDVAHALIRAAQRGVTCRAMADGLGSRALIRSHVWQEMKDAGVQMAVALPLDHPIRTLLTSRIDLRNHRKITVIDSQVTYCGSRNAADPEFLAKSRYAPWVDIMLRFEGSVVAQNELLFLSDWMSATGEALEGFTLSANPAEGGFPAQVMGAGPTERPGATPELFSTLIACARESVTLSTPYFVPDATVLVSGTTEIYGEAFNDGRVTETTKPRPRGPYATSKLASEVMFREILPPTARLILARPVNHTGRGQVEDFRVAGKGRAAVALEEQVRGDLHGRLLH